jgi:hypothetical protein
VGPELGTEADATPSNVDIAKTDNDKPPPYIKDGNKSSDDKDEDDYDDPEDEAYVPDNDMHMCRTMTCIIQI